ncbi:UDP-N-acetylmuramoyl-L-alanyl-D-glutamate--2,6-diaminopimelate ligase [Corynebacterium phocae]|uniref:UDP-N-acetylmuramoyl-L-alanyl-D-glutamate--2,6-diaminopimelate ligase n=1 Tax=Corynebacterium phocae TaxID=161895 RepID=A0A1L7D253_9CORY|nr:UDP-N-acetylmuramoyl-L-alanyl-D-glutamate--2,6-diaminopimelate ligase [Corynebacterium phocae]APT92225.1 UDP-N-acetylmuramoyl-L-alanyl-D-glutamate--2,6-diaminopimelate ligase [Corynebacterium phocae]KAA8725803.1 UDP-N-acetylmuramoyl-L-alanyl-D-glutamate--2,6-diaminopimelate ligase [Corynebacterium phocae]
MAFTVSSLAKLAGGRVHGEGAVTVDSVTLDSREVTATGLFAALPGTRAHGASFAADTPAAAVLSDAAGVALLTQTPGFDRPIIEVEDIRAVLGLVAAEVYGHPTRDMTVIGITGTSGKTTTSYLVEAGLLEAGHCVGLIGTTGTRINREPVPTKLTTPEAPRLQELFATMKSRNVTHVVMEVSSHALELGRVVGTEFDVAGFTNLSQDHLDFHPTMGEYFAAKEKLFHGLRAAVICVDDEWGQKLHQSVAAPTTTVATTGAADVQARTVAVEASGAQEVELNGHTRFRLPLPGPFNVANAALAIGLADAVGADRESFIRGLEGVAVPGRMERIDRGQDFIAVVDYAHKPAAVAAVLDTLREQLGDTGRIGIVVGAGGDRDSAKRAVMGANAAQRADLVIVTDDNPRTEDPAAIRAEVLSGARGHQAKVVEVASRAQAIAELVAWAGPGDAVIVVGKGHEVGQIYGSETLPFDDREEMARALSAKES